MGLRYSTVMKQSGLSRAGLALAFALAVTVVARAQTPLDEMEKELEQVKQERQDASSQTLVNFLAALQAASASPAAAAQLYEQAGGNMPAPTPVTTRYEHETPSEKAARLAQDQANTMTLGNMAQLHCGLMRFGVLFLENTPPVTLQKDWTDWLKSAAQIYPQLSGNDEIRNMALKDSPISSYYEYRGWGDKDQGKWNVRQMPVFYRQYVLEPLRNPVVAEVLPAWDTYIALRAANAGGNQDKWNNEDLPELQFERACDDYALAPGTEKLQTLVELIKAHPTHSKVDDWIEKVHDMLQAYKASHPGSSDSASAAPPAANPPAQ
jgi:hypothetical protein